MASFRCMPQIDVGGDRELEVVEGGDPAGAPVVVHHGTPGAAVLHPQWEAIAAAGGLRLVGYSRPGYGFSTRDRGRAVAAAAPDVAALADALGFDRFLTFGFSGGGPHALACAALLPDRVVAAAALGSAAPYGAPGLDFFDGMGEGNVEEFTIVLDGGEDAIRPRTEEEAAGMRDATQEQLVEAMAPFLTDADAEEMRGPIGATLLRQFQHGMSVSADGWVDDDVAFVRPWGFEPADIRVPVLLWQGRQDAMVPFGHGEWLARRIPGVRRRPVRARRASLAADAPRARAVRVAARPVGGGLLAAMRRIGLLGGMSWESSAEYYRLVNEAVRDRLGGLHSADCVLRSVDFAAIEQLQREGDWDAAGARLAGEARALVAAGAELLVLCTNTMHKVADAIAEAVDVPFVHIADTTADAVRAHGFATVGLLATGYTMEQDFYTGRLRDVHGLEVLIPGEPDRRIVHDVIYRELCVGVVDDGSRDEYRRIMRDLAGRGAEAILLGCTEIDLLVGQADSPVPVFDTTRLHAERAVELALA